MEYTLEECALDAKAIGPPPVTQCYKCQGFNHVAKDCKSEQKCVRCAGAHKSTECPDKNKKSLNLNVLIVMGTT